VLPLRGGTVEPWVRVCSTASASGTLAGSPPTGGRVPCSQDGLAFRQVTSRASEEAPLWPRARGAALKEGVLAALGVGRSATRFVPPSAVSYHCATSPHSQLRSAGRSGPCGRVVTVVRQRRLVSRSVLPSSLARGTRCVSGSARPRRHVRSETAARSRRVIMNSLQRLGVVASSFCIILAATPSLALGDDSCGTDCLNRYRQCEQYYPGQCLLLLQYCMYGCNEE
jgi:hypothetical protein